ncbi:hypothetical protein [Streptomyces sp. NPDC046853]|uniref:hypothetical protein n=1 Tax=unclassified Streptomyces TaxID=2593676 RepID=UPI0033E8661E
MPAEANRPWQLESFLDSVILDLDRAVDALSVKKDNVRMTYTVQDLSLALQVFPVYDGGSVRFLTAQPGQEGASTVSVQLGSIRDTQIREIARAAPTRDDVPLDLPEIAPQERIELERLGLRSADDVVRTVEENNVDLDRLTGGKVNYGKLAQVLRRARRLGNGAPRVDSTRFEAANVRGLGVLALGGRNLAPLPGSPPGYPRATVGERRVPARVSAGGRRLCVAVPFERPLAEQPVSVELDPYTDLTLRLSLDPPRPEHDPHLEKRHG